MGPWETSRQRRAWRPYIESSVLLETRLDEDLRASSGMSLLDFNLLLVLSESESHRLRMGELASRMVFSPSRLTYQITVLERRGWVLRQPAPDDRRVHHAVLTASGLVALREADRHHIETVRRLFTDDLADHELQVVADVFTRLSSRLHDTGRPGTGEEELG